jgi:hypothetical protein
MPSQRDAKGHRHRSEEKRRPQREQDGRHRRPTLSTGHGESAPAAAS